MITSDFCRSIVDPENFKEKQIHVPRNMRGDVATDGKDTQFVVRRLGLDPRSCSVTLGKSLRFSLALISSLIK